MQHPRANIFYWKCDNSLDSAQQKHLYLATKYNDAAMAATAEAIVGQYFKAKPDLIKPLGAAGNHFVYLAQKGDRQVLLRTDDGLTDDVYMDVENEVMKLAARAGVPVPQVYGDDQSCQKFPVRYQLLEYIPYPALSTQTIDDPLLIAAGAGEILAKLHSVKTAGYGFFESGAHLCGIDRSLCDYFNKCLEEHIGYLARQQMITAGQENEIRRHLSRASALLAHVPGALVHRDFAFWNLLGTPGKIHAVIDWDDAVSGDPADDFGILCCFHEPEFVKTALAIYGRTHGVDDEFRARMALHFLRNMLWKAVIRHRLGYFELGKSFFLNGNHAGMTLLDYTLYKLNDAGKQLELCL